MFAAPAADDQNLHDPVNINGESGAFR
jgi:hypothetical protein